MENNFDLVKYLKENHLGPHAILGAYVDLHALKEAEVGNNSIDPATLSAIDSWVKKNYPTARTPNPAEVGDVENYLGTDYIKLYKIEPNDPRQDVDDEDTTIAFINVTRDEDGNIIYYEVRDSIDYPGDYEQGEGNYGEPNGVWNSKTKEFIYDGYSSDDEGAEEFMEEDSKPKEKVAAAFLKPLVTVYGKDNVKIAKEGDFYKIYTKGKEELNNEADYGNNEPVDEVPYGDGEGRLDGFGDEFDQVAPVEEAMTAWEEKLNYYESEVNDLVYDMMDTTGADADQIADFFQYISTQVRNHGNY